MAEEINNVDPTPYLVYVDQATGEWGYRANLVTVKLTRVELDRFVTMSPDERIAAYRERRPYFGDVAEYRPDPRRTRVIEEDPETDL